MITIRITIKNRSTALDQDWLIDFLCVEKFYVAALIKGPASLGPRQNKVVACWLRFHRPYSKYEKWFP